MISIQDIDAFVFDFDGVMTNNLVYLDQEGRELVSCSRADGLAFDALRKIGKPAYILSTEKNTVVTARANKLGIEALQGISDKVAAIRELANRENYNLAKILYTGNDINDYRAMQECGYSACPSDSHEQIIKLSTFVLDSKGGNGVVRELLEKILKLDFDKILYS